MLKQIDMKQTTPNTNLIGIEAAGKVTQTDYENVFIPLLKQAHQDGKKVRLLYHIGPEFSGFTAGAAWDDFKVGLKYIRLIERCAVVTDVEWIKNATQFFSGLLPCPTKTFSNDQMKQAVDWISSSESSAPLTYKLTDKGVLTVEPHGPLSKEDFDKLSSVIDPWIESHHKLQGLVISMKKFPGWEDFGSLVRHFEFVQGHHKKVKKVALAVDGVLPEIASHVAKHFVQAEIKSFPAMDVNQAEEWAWQ